MMSHFRRKPVVGGFGLSPRVAWALCADARSGSTWLSQLAASTGLLGVPDEYLLNWQQWCIRLGLSAAMPREDYLSCLVRQFSTANGVFGIKGSLAQLAPFFDLFPNAPCVWLTRDNKLEQAVSWQRANDGGVWHRTAGTDAENPRPVSADRILGFYDEILRRETLWRDFFRARPVAPLLLTYEAVVQDPLSAVQAIADHIGVPAASIKQVDSPLQIVRDGHTAEWVERAAQALRQRSNRAM